MAERKTDFQIRGMPVALRERLRRRARRKGMSISRYMIDLARRDVERLTMDEWLDLLKEEKPLRLPVSAAELVHEARREMGWED